LREVINPTACVGCLDTRRCWVCLGRGSTEIESLQRYGARTPCSACKGTGVCSRCEAVPQQRVLTRDL